MTNERESMSPTYVGLGVLWPACWTGIPIKLAIAVLALAMDLMHFEGRLGIAFLMLLASPVTVFAVPIIAAVFDSHFGEGVGIPLLFLISIPIDIWALGVVGKTFFLERFQKEPPDGLGLTLWWKSALMGAFFLPLVWFLVGAVTSLSVSTSESLMEMESLRHLFGTGLPVAERISLELIMWGSIASAVLIVLLLIGISMVGKFIRGMAEAAQPARENYQGLITRWDLMRVPADQGLFLTVVTGAGVVLILLFWAALPVTTPHPHECCAPPEAKAQPPFKPLDALKENEQRIAQLTVQLNALEQQQAEADSQKGKGTTRKTKTRKGEAGKGKTKGSQKAASPAVTKP